MVGRNGARCRGPRHVGDSASSAAALGIADERRRANLARRLETPAAAFFAPWFSAPTAGSLRTAEYCYFCVVIQVAEYFMARFHAGFFLLVGI